MYRQSKGLRAPCGPRAGTSALPTGITAPAPYRHAGAEFQDDESNLAAWRETFGQNHYWAQRVGSLLAIGLSTVRFRSNTHSVHEVHIDDQQLEWFEATLEANRGVPVAVFTHAPPIGSGLRVVERVHVKNRCAWLNHSSSNAGRFVQLCEKYPNVALWCVCTHSHRCHTDDLQWRCCAYE